jgi:hypothetical protein
MIINDKSAGRIRAPFVRTLACVLLASIIYAVTFDAAHSHRNLSPKLDVNSSASATTPVSALSEGSLYGNSDRSECLICVLHLQFSNGTVHTPLFVVRSYAEVAFATAPTFFYRSTSIASRPIGRLSGRAPPVNRG